MRVLGIDPGYDRCGWAIVEGDKSTYQSIDYDSLQTDRSLPQLERYKQIHNHFNAVITKYQPEAIAIEKLYFSRNVSTALPVSEVRGLIFGLSFGAGIPVYEYGPGTVKVAVSGYGKASKADVSKMITLLLKLEKSPKIDDTSDALAVGLTHLLVSR